MALETVAGSTTLLARSGFADAPLAITLAAAMSVGATEAGATSGNVAAAVCAASLPAVSGKTNYLTGVQFTFSGATLGSTVLATLTGLAIGTLSFVINAPVGILVGGDRLIVDFQIPRAASAANTAITFSCPSLGAGNTNACVNIQGFTI